MSRHKNQNRGTRRVKKAGRLVLWLLLVALLLPAPALAQSGEPAAVRAVIFFSPYCGHCHQVMTQLLLPMLAEYGDQLEIAAFDTTQPAGSQLFQAATELYDAQRVVPLMVVQDRVLLGSVQIPAEFPAIVEAGLEGGGIDWPGIPGLTSLLDQADSEILSPAAVAAAAAALEAGGQVESSQEPPPDPVGYALASIVLVGLVASLGYAAWRLSRPAAWRRLRRLSPPARPQSWVIPFLCLLGLGVASYLAYVEVKQVDAVCGPVGECNLVQTSEYALFLGLPVAVWGVLNYLAVAGLWLGSRLLRGRPADLSLMGLLALTLFGVLFSIYLTCLELFAIHAICAWCLSSALITAALMLLVVVPVTDLKKAVLRPRRKRRTA